MFLFLKNKLSNVKKDIIGPKIEYGINNIKYINWIHNKWIEDFIKINIGEKVFDNLCLCSVDGKRPKQKYFDRRKTIFFTIENLEPIINHEHYNIDEYSGIYRWLDYAQRNYADYMLKDVDLSIGFKNIVTDKYIRFPYWITTLFPPEADYKKIKEIISIINNSNTLGLREAVCINRHDAFGTREKIYNDLHEVLEITCAGKWNNNTAELWSAYNNDKLKYMNLFKFNICPENMDAEDYCTEKIFDAFKAGCVPIYAGALNKPEPDIINYDRVIFWDLDGDNQEQIKFVDKLNKNDDLFYKFAKQPKLNDYAVEYVAERFELLRLKLKEILS